MNPAPAPAAGRWGDLRTRIVSAAVLAPLALACIWLGGIAFAALVAAMTIALAYEWLHLCGRLRSMPCCLVFAALPAAVACAAAGAPILALAVLAAGLLAGMAVTRTGWPLPFGIPYFGLAAVSLVWLRQAGEAGRANVIVLLLVVWASDIGAYTAGRAIGGPKLAPRISPGKTISGSAGGLCAAALVGAVAAWAGGAHGLPWRAILAAAVIGGTAQAGDLFESWVKRRFGVKDSGRLIPGHGGALDRLDAVLTAAPVAVLLALVLGGGVVIWR